MGYNTSTNKYITYDINAAQKYEWESKMADFDGFVYDLMSSMGYINSKLKPKDDGRFSLFSKEPAQN